MQIEEKVSFTKQKLMVESKSKITVFGSIYKI
jgi:hypothetical protein